MAQSSPLTAANQITENEANLLPYRGIPSAMQKKIRHKIPANWQTATAVPSIVDVWRYLQDLFSEDNLNNYDNNNVELSLDSEDDLDTSDMEDEEYYTPRTHKKPKKKAKYNITKDKDGAMTNKDGAATNEKGAATNDKEAATNEKGAVTNEN